MSCGGCKRFTDDIERIGIEKLEPVIEKYAGVEGSLVTILQKTQEIFGYLSRELLLYVAERTGIKPAKVLGVASFYTQFRMKPVGKHLILICQGTACHVNGSDAIEEAVREELAVKEGEISEDGLFTYNNVACLGCCSLSPVMMVGNETFGTLTAEKAKNVIREIRKKEGAANV